MDALEVLLGMLVLRVILPLSALLLAGEWAGKRSRQPHTHR